MVYLLEAERLRVEMVPLQPQARQFAEQAVHGPAGGKEIRGERNHQRRQRDGGELVLVIDARPAEAEMAGARLTRPVAHHGEGLAGGKAEPMPGEMAETAAGDAGEIGRANV